MITIDEINEIIDSGNRASKLSDKQARDIAELMLTMIPEKENDNKIAEYIMILKPTVCLMFFESAIENIDSDKILSIHSAICKTDAYKRNKNNAAIIRGFAISAVLIKRKHESANIILGRTIVDADKDGKFSDAIINHFKKNVVDYCGGLEPISELEKVEWKNKGQYSRFISFMQCVSSSYVNIIPGEKPNKSSEKSLITDSGQVTQENVSNNEKSNSIQNIEDKDKPAPNVNELSTLKNELFIILSSATCEAKELTKILRESNGTIAMLRNDIIARDAKISEMKATIASREHEVMRLNHEIDDLRRLLQQKETQISDVTERLKTAMQMDNISQNQELITLKTNLQNSLKIEYDDYLVSKNSECSPDSYTALLGSLARIFKILKRYEISID